MRTHAFARAGARARAGPPACANPRDRREVARPLAENHELDAGSSPTRHGFGGSVTRGSRVAEHPTLGGGSTLAGSAEVGEGMLGEGMRAGAAAAAGAAYLMGLLALDHFAS